MVVRVLNCHAVLKSFTEYCISYDFIVHHIKIIRGEMDGLGQRIILPLLGLSETMKLAITTV